jgi:hypothetical protein
MKVSALRIGVVYRGKYAGSAPRKLLDRGKPTDFGWNATLFVDQDWVRYETASDYPRSCTAQAFAAWAKEVLPR